MIISICYKRREDVKEVVFIAICDIFYSTHTS